jgi:hypothetical protein
MPNSSSLRLLGPVYFEVRSTGHIIKLTTAIGLSASPLVVIRVALYGCVD